MESEHRLTFVSKVQFFQELHENSKVKVWVRTPPNWLPYGQPLYLYTTKFKADTLKGMYYYPGLLEFFVDNSYEIHQIKYVFEKEHKCIIL